MKNLFSIDDRVTSKQTGLPMCGNILSIMCDKMLFFSQRKTPADYKEWTRLYENWRDKPIYTVKFDTPQRPMTYMEWLNGHEPEDKEFAKSQYELSVNSVPLAVYVEDDLEKL